MDPLYGEQFPAFDGALSLVLVHGSIRCCGVLRQNDNNGQFRTRGFSTRRLCADICSAKAKSAALDGFASMTLPLLRRSIDARVAVREQEQKN